MERTGILSRSEWTRSSGHFALDLEVGKGSLLDFPFLHPSQAPMGASVIWWGLPSVFFFFQDALSHADVHVPSFYSIRYSHLAMLLSSMVLLLQFSIPPDIVSISFFHFMTSYWHYSSTSLYYDIIFTSLLHSDLPMTSYCFNDIIMYS